MLWKRKMEYVPRLLHSMQLGFMLSINRAVTLSSVLPGFRVPTVLCYHGNGIFFFSKGHIFQIFIFTSYSCGVALQKKKNPPKNRRLEFQKGVNLVPSLQAFGFSLQLRPMWVLSLTRVKISVPFVTPLCVCVCVSSLPVIRRKQWKGSFSFLRKLH